MHKMNTQQKQTLRQRIRMAAEKMDLPDGMIHGMPQIILDGDLQLLIERHMGVIEYGTDRICIAAKKNTIEIMGQSMYLVAMDRDSIRIRGVIHCVRYLTKEETHVDGR